MSTKTKSFNREYQIIDIKEERMFYIVYAQKEDSIFKIISEKMAMLPPCKNVEIGGFYALNLNVIFPLDTLLGHKIMPNLGIQATFRDGTPMLIEERSHYRLYEADNLRELCYLETQKKQ